MPRPSKKATRPAGRELEELRAHFLELDRHVRWLEANTVGVPGAVLETRDRWAALWREMMEVNRLTSA